MPYRARLREKIQWLARWTTACHSSYGQKYGTSVYKLLNASDWNDGLAKCNSEPGLVKSADAND
ncbi:hypothetical protein BOX15_Mlig005066g1 [Macrostomum lignano]|uniref:Uncharacterized protein n=1 Tax=Macrostomum lignano TaxID=282301 RepID=A0A267EUH6_9PLAT|nr:hypothetical protein BOX15_Mlig005066g1 [Macrostomum lignano]